MTVIDAHAHLWKTQNGIVNGMPVRGLRNGRSEFCGEIRQMTPPYMTDGENLAETFLSNMDYARVAGAVITQEEMDGRQDGYLLTVKEKYPAAVLEKRPYHDILRRDMGAFHKRKE